MKKVPWSGFDVLLILGVWLAPLLLSVVLTIIASQLLAIAPAEETQDHGHALAQLIEQSGNSPVILLIALIAGVIVAPIVEEFLFRMLLQGWLEAKFHQLQIPHASGIAIVTVALFFAAIHIDSNEAIDVWVLLIAFLVMSVYSLLIFMAGILYLTLIRNVPIGDYLIGTERFFRPGFFKGAGCCLLVILLCFALNAALGTMYPNTNVAPITIFFFALALGVLYSRTQNLSYCVLLHACLNAISLALVWLGVE